MTMNWFSRGNKTLSFKWPAAKLWLFLAAVMCRGMEPVGAKGSLLCLVLLLYFQFLLPHHHLEIWSLHSAADGETWLNLQMMLSWTLTLENICTDSSPRRQIYKKKKLSTWCFRLHSFIQHGCQSGAPTAATLSAVTLVYFEASGGNWIHSAPHNTERAAGCWLNLFRQEQRFLQEVGERVWAARTSEHMLVFAYFHLKRGESSPLQEFMTQLEDSVDDGDRCCWIKQKI